MLKQRLLAALLAAGIAGMPGLAGAQAASATATLSININAPLTIAFAPAKPTLACETAPGTVAATISAGGGNGGAFASALTGSSDFVLAGANIVVGSAGISSANCGKIVTLSVTASQQ